MADRRRDHKTKDLPPNLYCRNGYYSFRDPRTGKESGLGRDERYAANEAVAANMIMIPENGLSLADGINGKEIMLFDSLINAYKADLSARELSNKTIRNYQSRMRKISANFSGLPGASIDAKYVSKFLDRKASEGKKKISNLLRVNAA